MHEASNFEVETVARGDTQNSATYGFKLWQLRAISVSGVALIGLVGFVVGYSVQQDSNSSAAPAPPPSLQNSSGSLKSNKRRIIVIRHCVRSTSNAVYSTALDGDNPPLPQVLQGRELTARQLPDWGVPLNWCTKGGHEIMKHTGKWLASELAIDPAMTTITSDVVMRDAQTGLAIAEGLLKGTEGAHDKFQKFHFDRTLAGDGDPEVACEHPTDDEISKDIQALIAKTPMPAGVGLPDSPGFESRFTSVLQKLTHIVGNGNKSFEKATKPFVAIGKGRPRAHGTFKVPYFFSQQMMYSWASGTPWIPDLSTDDIMYWSAWEYYMRLINNPPSIGLPRVTTLMQTILGLFGSLEANGFMPGRSHIFAAHDSTLDGLRLGLNISWLAPPFHIWPDARIEVQSGPTPPGSGIMLTMDESSEEIRVDFLYPNFDGTTTPEIRSTHIRTFKHIGALKETAEVAWASSPSAQKCWVKTAKSFSEKKTASNR